VTDLRLAGCSGPAGRGVLRGAFVSAAYVPVKMLVFPNLLITMHQAPVPVFDVVAKQLDGRVLNVSWLVYDLLKAVTGRYFFAVEDALAEVDNLDHLVDVLTRTEQSDWLRRVRLSRHSLTSLQMSLSAKRKIINGMSREDSAGGFFPNLHYLHDLFDYQSVMLTRLEFAQKMLICINQAFLAKSDLEISTCSADISVFTKRLTLIATCIMPATLITGFFGMNVRLPGMISTPQDNESLIDGFVPFICIAFVILLIIFGGMACFKYRRMF